MSDLETTVRLAQEQERILREKNTAFEAHWQKEEQWMIDTKLLLEQIAKTLKKLDARDRRDSKRAREEGKQLQSFAMSMGKKVSGITGKTL